MGGFGSAYWLCSRRRSRGIAWQRLAPDPFRSQVHQPPGNRRGGEDTQRSEGPIALAERSSDGRE